MHRTSRQITFIVLLICLSILQLLLEIHHTWLFVPSEHRITTVGQEIAVTEKTTTKHQEGVVVKANERKRSTVLMGIFTSDLSRDEVRYRTMFRELLQIHYPKVCSFHDYSNSPSNVNDDNSSDWQLLQENCELMYTFVLGGGGDSDNANVTEITRTVTDLAAINVTSQDNDDEEQQVHFDNYDTSFIASQKSNSLKFATDAENADMTFLNIRENMNFGKSQTWFSYASIVAEKFDIDYIMKIDTDTVLYLDRYMDFVHWTLPPYPYNNGIIVGQPIPKHRWKMTKQQERVKEKYFQQHYPETHIYAAGQMYMLSRDVARHVGLVASHEKTTQYKENIEDHDISLMAFLSRTYGDPEATIDHPLHFVMISRENPFWKHNVKIKHGVNKWKKVWNDEIHRQNDIVNARLNMTTVPSSLLSVS